MLYTTDVASSITVQHYPNANLTETSLAVSLVSSTCVLLRGQDSAPQFPQQGLEQDTTTVGEGGTLFHSYVY